jgi:CelD/BcsL family acetyltransferase involved in cellulose biosynthesis
VTDWSALDPSREPLAPGVGPFPHRWFLEVWQEHHGSPEVEIVDAGGCSWVFVRRDGRLEVAGDADLTDYRSPLGAQPDDVIASVIEATEPGTRFVFDSLPLEAAEPIAKAVERAGVAAAVEPDGHTMVLHLTGDDHLDLLDAKQRHEVRRKERRLAEALGDSSLQSGPALLEEFIAQHRAAAGEKGRFMTPALASFFADLLSVPGARLDALITDSGRPAAVAFGFEDDDAYYLYNSAYDPEMRQASPGIVLIHRLVERSIADGRSRFDFLKGSETYKRRLGAKTRPLYRIEGVV